MANQDNPFMRPMMNDFEPQSWGSKPAAVKQSPSNRPMPPMPAEAMKYQLIYPEVYYRLQPYIMVVCDEMDTYGSAMPTQDMIEKMSDNIYEDMRTMYPDMVDYMSENEAKQTIAFNDDRSHFRGRFRRRGAFKDLIEILLLAELANRRRRRF